MVEWKDGCLVRDLAQRDICRKGQRSGRVRRRLYERCPSGLKQQKIRPYDPPELSTDVRGIEKESRDFVGHHGCVNAVAFSQSGNLLLSGSDDTTVKLWEVESRRCLRTLPGHMSNVFATEFLPNKCEMEYVSGGNEADIRYWQMGQDGSAISTVYKHHTRKVLRLNVLTHCPDAFLSCSADGTVRMFDTRKKYPLSECKEVPSSAETNVRGYYNGQTIYSVEMHPTDGHSFVIACEDGITRLYDMRRIPEDPYDAINVYANVVSPMSVGSEATGVTFNWNGTEIAVSNISDNIYLYDKDTRFDADYSHSVDRVSSSVFEVLREMAQQHALGERAQFQFEGEYSDSDSVSSSDVSEEDSVGPPNESGVTGAEEYDPFADDPFADAVMEDQGEYDLREEGHAMHDYHHDSEEEHAALLGSMPDVPSSPPESRRTYKAVYTGHVSERTIKGLAFYGTRSEYLMSGSDEGRIYFWDTKTTRLVACLCGHASTVNNVLQHPKLPAIVSSGIDDVVKLWTLENLDEKETDSEAAVAEALGRDDAWV